MKYTCAEAAKVLRKLNEDLRVLRAKEVKGYRFTGCGGGLVTGRILWTFTGGLVPHRQ